MQESLTYLQKVHDEVGYFLIMEQQRAASNFVAYQQSVTQGRADKPNVSDHYKAQRKLELDYFGYLAECVKVNVVPHDPIRWTYEFCKPPEPTGQEETV
jgi:hypothetical protein